ncbi:hypothetical protein LSH36_87g01000 [Paralvinella palmiformis]|uniref:Uncharacterized protein n=1 Tax=Paralvinella palmiformis TaxID=53620 RepID=A0AAD9K1W8_9ANNE|nr:hypothetical protein LSH36_87g01000 [Paralvinella palmiformis]
MRILYTVTLVLYTLSIICTTEARRTRSNCRGIRCLPARCIDAVMDQRGCCLTCPHGENCILFGELLPANQMIIHHTGDCEWTCRCPGSYAYEVHREKTPASCHMLCRGGFVSPDEIDESYNLIEPSNILKKKEFVRSSLRDILLRGINEGEDLD